MSQLVTGEAVALDLRPAALPSRLLAALLDALVVVVLLVVVGAVFTQVASGLSSAGAAALVTTLVVLVLLGYPVLCETLWRGRTLGKAALGLRVVRDDGGPIGFRQAFVRALVGLFVERPGITLGVVAVVTSLASAQGKRLGDLLAGTVVLQERVVATRGAVASMPPPLAPWAASLDLSALPQPLYLAVRQFVSRADQLHDAARTTLGNQLVGSVLACTSPPPPPGTPGWAVLSAVLAERRRREEQRSGTPVAPTWGQPAYGAPAAPVATPAPVAAPTVDVPAVPAAPPEPGPGGFAAPR